MQRCVQRIALGLLFTLISVAIPAFAQITGDLLINVSDQTSAAVPNAAVQVRNIETGATRSATTDTAGTVRINQLTVGQYEIKVSREGFTTGTATAGVASGTAVTVPFTLAVATANQQIVVVDQASPVNTVNPQLQVTVETSTIHDLPLVRTGVLGVATMSPGVVPVTPNNPFLGLGSYNSNGGRGRGNNITLDNATTTDISTTGSAGLGTLPLDAIQEVNFITNQFSAEFGRNANSQFQILSRSGSNDFHGEMFEFAQNSLFNARDYFDRSGSAVPNINNDWGAIAGGHIIRDKLFFFGTYEQNTIRGLGGTRIATVPRTDQADPAAPVAQQILKQYQVPLSPTGSVSVSAPNATDTLAYSGRIDYNISSKDVFYARFGEQSANASSAGLTWIDSNLPTNGASSTNRAWNGTLTETHTFSPVTVNTFLAAYGRSAPAFPPLTANKGPEIIFGDSTSNFGTWSGLPQGRLQNTYQYQDIVSHVIGKHQLKFGAELDRIQANSYFDSNVNGSLTYLTLSDFLADKPFLYSQRFGNSVRGNRVWNEFFFAQDDWHIKRNLTVNIGFREEISNGATEVNNILSNLDISKTSTALGAAGTGPLGAFYTGGSYFKTNYNPGPRIGFAWNPGGGKTVIRGGYGISYDFIYLNPITNGRFLPPFMYQFSLPQSQISGANAVAAIYAHTSPFQQQGAATVGTFGTNVLNFGSFNYIDPKLRNPQYQQYSFTIERSLFNNWVVRATYSGSKGSYLTRTRPINLLAPGVFTPPATLAEQQQMQAAGVFSAINNGLNAPFNARSNRIDPRFDNVGVVESSGNSNYNSLQLYAARRMSDWYGFTAAYTWSKSIDDVSDALGVLAFDSASQQDPRNNWNNRAVSAFDIPQNLVITHDFRSSRKAFSSRFLNELLGGWEFSGIFSAHTGFPVNLTAGTIAGLSDATLLGGNNALRPDLVGQLNLHYLANPGGGSKNPNLVTNSGLAQPLVGHFGTLGRNVLRLNPWIQSDMTVGRIFRFNERLSFNLQAQVFNVFNNTTFSSPGISLSAPATFGYYNATDTNSRRLVLLGRLTW